MDTRTTKVNPQELEGGSLTSQAPPPYQETKLSAGESSQRSTDSSKPYKLYVDYRWKKFQNVVRESPDPASEPIYVIKYNFPKSLDIVFNLHQSDRTIGTGTLRASKVPDKCQLNDKPLDLTRIGGKYEYSSQALTNDQGRPMKMTWVSASGWRDREFHCLDEQSNGIARFAVDAYNLKRAGIIEFMTRIHVSDALRDEIVVTGMTLACQAAPGSSPVVIV